MVTADGVAMTFVVQSPWIARSMAAKFTPVAAMRPMPNVEPVRERRRVAVRRIVDGRGERRRGSRRRPAG